MVSINIKGAKPSLRTITKIMTDRPVTKVVEDIVFNIKQVKMHYGDIVIHLGDVESNMDLNRVNLLNNEGKAKFSRNMLKYITHQYNTDRVH